MLKESLNGWPIVTVADIAAPIKYACVGGPFGSSLTLKDYVESGVPISRGSNLYLGNGSFHDADFVFVSEEKANLLAQNAAYPGDIVFTQRGTIGQVAWIPKNAKYARYILSQNQMKITIDPEKVNVLYVLYYFLSPTAQDLIRQNSIGSTIPGFNLTQLRQFPIPLPPLETQQAIVSILKVLDDKIDLNRRMNETLEQTARAIFKDWFVDFGPTRAKMAGQEAYLSEDLWALFPERLDEAGVPEGWFNSKVSDIGSVVCGKTPSTKVQEYYGDDVPFITIPDMHGKTFATETGKKLSRAGAESQSKKTLPKGTICVSCIATPGLVVVTTEPSQTNQQVNSVIPLMPGETYFWFWMLKGLGELIKQGGSGGSVLANLSTGRFSVMNVLNPHRSLRCAYHAQVEALFERVLANEYESQTLAQTRDLLLPKLMSGELRVQDAEAQVAEVL